MSLLPLYHRVFLSLRDRIINGIYDSLEPMPGENSLSKDFDVSRSTIRKALELLEEEGLIVRSQGSRTYARSLGYDAKQKRQNLEDLTNSQDYRELFPGDVEQSYTLVKAGRLLSRQFSGLKELARISRVREADGQPYCFVVTYLSLEIANKISWNSLGSMPVITAALNAGYDFSKVEQTIRATTADEEAALGLAVAVGSSLLRISGLFIDADGRCVMRKDGYFHPDSFEYSTTIYKS